VVLGGNGGCTFVGTSYSYSYSYSSQKPKIEVKRQVDEKRVYQETQNPDGTTTINKDNYVDIEQIKKILLAGGKEPDRIVYGNYKDGANVEVLRTDITKFPEPLPFPPPLPFPGKT